MSELAQVIQEWLNRPDPQRPGLFVSFEGGDGSGKTTQVELVGRLLETSDLPLCVTREPGGTPLGKQLRHLVQHGPEDVDPRTEALLYAADRAYHVATMLRPQTESGAVVLCDRYTDSSAAYQGAARQLGTDEVRGLSNWATRDFQPDVTVLLDVDSEAGMTRIGDVQDRLERAGADFHARVREEYLVMARNEPDRFVVVDASGPTEQVFEEVVAGLVNRLRQKTASSP